ncbi:MAG: ABC transporter substrate-binding protein [Spirochaetaceae bacterium]|nr:ABC transporter substrate-binding protein [Spirochaetaceae bacterium]
MKTKLWMAAAGLSLLVSFSGCAKKSGGGTPAALPERVNIGTQQMPNDENVAKAKGYFDSLGVPVNLLEFDSGSAAVNAVVSGSVDLALMGTTPATTAIANNLPVEVIWIHGILGKSEALAVRNAANITSVAELSGKKAATPFGSTGHYSLLSALALNGVPASAVTLLDMQPKDIYAAWSRGDIDAAYVWDPVLAKLLEDGKLLLSSEDLALQGVITADIEIVNRDFGKKYPQAVSNYLSALSKTQGEYRKDFNGTAAALARYFSISVEESEQQLRGNIWLSAEEQLGNAYFGTSAVPGDFAKALKKTADFLVTQKTIAQAPDIGIFQKAVNPHYIELLLGK